MKLVYLGLRTLWLKQSITKSMVLHTTEESGRIASDFYNSK